MLAVLKEIAQGTLFDKIPNHPVPKFPRPFHQEQYDPKTDFGFSVQGNPQELAGIAINSANPLRGVINWTLLNVAVAIREKRRTENFGEPPAQIEIPRKLAEQTARAVRDHINGKGGARRIPVLEMTFSETFVSLDPNHGWSRVYHVPKDVLEWIQSSFAEKAKKGPMRFPEIERDARYISALGRFPEDPPRFGIDQDYTDLRRAAARREHIDQGIDPSTRRTPRHR